MNRFPDALAALRNFVTYGDRVAAKIQRTQGLIEEIERAMRCGAVEPLRR